MKTPPVTVNYHMELAHSWSIAGFTSEIQALESAELLLPTGAL
jgi:hypothetical protein